MAHCHDPNKIFSFTIHNTITHIKYYEDLIQIFYTVKLLLTFKLKLSLIKLISN